MDSVRVKVSVKPSSGKLSLESVASFISNVLTFLDNITRDSGIIVPKSNWTAMNFKDESFSCDANLPVEQKGDVLRSNIQSIVLHKCRPELVDNGIRIETIESYFNIPKEFAPNDNIFVGLYRDGEDSPIIGDEFLQHEAIYELTKLDKTAIEVNNEITYYGSIRGIVHAWYKEAENPHLSIRDIITGKLIKCFYETSLYNEIHNLLERRSGIVIVNGHIKANKEKREGIIVFIDKVNIAPDFHEEDIDKFIGCVPSLTGGLTPGEYLEKLYENEIN